MSAAAVAAELEGKATTQSGVDSAAIWAFRLGWHVTELFHIDLLTKEREPNKREGLPEIRELSGYHHLPGSASDPGRTEKISSPGRSTTTLPA